MLTRGSIFHGYRILAFIGAGGSGAVYHAVQCALAREVALKIVRVTGAESQEERKRFRREAKALARLTHANIIRIYEFGDEGDLLFYSMEFVPASSVDRPLLEGRPYSRADTVRIVSQVLDALEAAHGVGVLHRDLKPANVLARRNGDIILADFGIAHEQGATRITRDGEFLGTMPYMPPEIAGPEPYDARGDLYQVGVMTFELLSGKLPYSNDQVFAALAGTPPPLEPALASVQDAAGPALTSFLRKAMAFSPVDRFTAAAQMRHALQAAFQDRSAPSPTPVSTPVVLGPVTPARPVDARRPLLVASALCWLLALAGLAAFFVWQRPRDADPATKAAQPASPPAARSADWLAQWREFLRAEIDLPMTPSPGGGRGRIALEVLVLAAAELQEARLVWLGRIPAVTLDEINGHRVRGPAEPLPLGMLRTGINRFVFGHAAPAGASFPSALLRVRRRPGTDVAGPEPPASPDEAAPSLPADARKMLDEASRCSKTGRFDEALEKATRLAELFPDCWQVQRRRAIALHHAAFAVRGLSAATQGLFTPDKKDRNPDAMQLEAFQCFNRALALEPLAASVWEEVGCACRDLNRLADARRAGAMACLLGTGQGLARWELVRTLATRSQRRAEGSAVPETLALATARAAFDGLGKLRPEWLLERAAFFRQRGLLEEARADLRRALDLEPGSSVARAALDSLPLPPAGGATRTVSPQ